MPNLQLIRTITWIIVGVIAIGLMTATYMVQKNNTLTSSSMGKAAVGGPFSLISQTGQRIDNKILAGKPYLAFFGFTHCPDVCPTTLFELTEIMQDLGSDADKFNVLLITVDPERDSRETLAAYMTSFDSRIMALRGSREETDAVVKAFAAYAQKVPMDGGRYTMEHTAGVYVMDAKGEFSTLMRMDDTRDEKIRMIRRVIG